MNNLETYIRALETHPVSVERKLLLEPIAAFIRQRRLAEDAAALTFICTHNSRRSHLAQVWAQVFADRYGYSRVTTFSGGTEVTAFHPHALGALKRAGFEIEPGMGDNPRQLLRYDGKRPTMLCYSKRYDDTANPQSGYAAIMTCDEADAACPVIAGCDARFSLPYRDPKRFDQHPDPAQHYDATCREIATEMQWVFHHAAKVTSQGLS